MLLRTEHTCPPGRTPTEDIATVRLRGAEGGLWVEVEAPFHGDPLPDAPPGRLDKLWEYEVVELFVAGSGEPVRYTELELGPGGHYLLYQLCGVRQPERTDAPIDPVITQQGTRWTARVFLPDALLPPAPWRVNATAIHGRGAARRYLSAADLGPGGPDFHRPDRFLPVKTTS